jgi:predicted P-loop ATPase
MVAAKRKHHPIREFLNSLPLWDKTVRVETLLIDHLGAEDTAYIRAVTRKTIVAAVARVYVPGIKFDSVLVMDGPQEKGKSTLFNKLAGDEWFNDGLTLTDMQDKSGAEKYHSGLSCLDGSCFFSGARSSSFTLPTRGCPCLRTR